MILVLIAAWLGLLWLLVKVGVFKAWRPWMTASPLVVWLVGFMAIFLPLNWTAPMGDAVITVGSVGIKPGVGGVVTEVAATSWTPIETGEALFRIDDVAFAAALQKAEAEMALAEEQLARREALLERNAVAQAEVDALRADVAVAAAAVTQAEADLEKTVVRAPFDGIVPAVTLLTGARVDAGAPVMAFLDVERPVTNLVLRQNQIRHLKVGQPAEAVFRSAPGRTYAGVVSGLYLSSAAAEYDLDGATPEAPQAIDTAYVVTLDLDFEGDPPPPGASGTGLVLTDRGAQFHVVQRIALRMTTWLNFF